MTKKIPTMDKETAKVLTVALLKIMLKDYAISILMDDREAMDTHFNNIIQEFYNIVEENKQ